VPERRTDVTSGRLQRPPVPLERANGCPAQDEHHHKGSRSENDDLQSGRGKQAGEQQGQRRTHGQTPPHAPRLVGVGAKQVPERLAAS
jgi:hypothetical protein